MPDPDRRTALLRLEPHMLPELATAYGTALNELRPLINRLFRSGRLERAWTEDPVTRQIAARFNEYAMDGTQSAYGAIRRYEHELVSILDTLRRMESDYGSTEGTAASLMRRQ
jgi:hypothetical protein